MSTSSNRVSAQFERRPAPRARKGYKPPIENARPAKFVQLKCNYYPINFLNATTITINKYKIAIEKKGLQQEGNPSKNLRVIHLMMNDLMALAWQVDFTFRSRFHYACEDGFFLYTTEKFPKNLHKQYYNSKNEIRLDHTISPYDFTATFTEIGEIELKNLSTAPNPAGIDAALEKIENPSEELQALRALISITFNKEIVDKKCIKIGSSVFKVSEEHHKGLTRASERLPYIMWLGSSQKVVLGKSNSLYLNLDIDHHAFLRKGQLSEFMKEACKWNMTEAFNVLDGTKIKYKIPGTKKYSVLPFNGFAQTADKEEFFTITNSKITCQQHLNITYPNFIGTVDWSRPLVRIGTRNLINDKNVGICVPVEWCEILGNQPVMRSMPQLTSAMIKVCTKLPDVRHSQIHKFMGDTVWQKLNQIGVNVEPKAVEVPGKVMSKPQMKSSTQNSRFTELAWDNMEDSLLRYSVINLNSSNNTAVIDRLTSTLKKYFGKSDSVDSTVDLYKTETDQFEEKLKEALAQCKWKRAEIVFVLLNDERDCYRKVKVIADLQVGIVTQCIKQATLVNNQQSRYDAAIKNIVAKCNAKLNGINHEIDEEIFNEMMFIGTTIKHAGPNECIPSIVGVASSYNLNGSKFCSDWKVQGSQQSKEIILGIDDIVLKHIKNYKDTNKKLPKHILYYRDGVSETQFKKVLKVELEAIEKAIGEYPTDIDDYFSKPKITFIVVTQRHHARFFRFENEKILEENVEAATVIDEQIVHPNISQFFMISHKVKVGVAKPMKYWILKNDAKLPTETIEHISYCLCNNFV